MNYVVILIDLLINMSEIYGQPNGNNIRTIDDEDEDEEYLERDNLNDEDNEQQEWNIETQTEECDDDNMQINGLRSNSYLNSKLKLINSHSEKKNARIFQVL